MSTASAAQKGAIHSISKSLGLDEESRRDVIASVAGGKRSSSELSTGEAILVIDRLKALQGSQAGGAKGARVMDGAYAPKLLALWISGWHLGVVRDRSDSSLLAFLERQTGLSHVRFLRDSAQARGVIEALKAWLSREAGVDWPPRGEKEDVRANKLAVLFAQRRLLEQAGADVSAMPSGAGLAERAIDAEIRSGGALLRRLLKEARRAG